MDPFSINIAGVGDLVNNPTNKVPVSGSPIEEGQIGEQRDPLALDMSDEELLRVKKEIEVEYATYEARMKSIWARNLESYLGKRKDGQWLVEGGPTAANLQFEAEETFLAAALAKNPEPVVWADNTEEGNEIAKAVKTMLTFHSDQLVLRRKLAFMVRQWSIYHLSVLKFGWNKVESIVDGRDLGDVDIMNRRIQNFVFDVKGYVNVYGEFVGMLGERIETTAQKLADHFPHAKQTISDSVAGKMGTKVIYTEWWSADNTFSFLTYKDVVLDKYKNPYFKYPENQIDPVTGQPSAQKVPGNNHFAVPKKPYIFLSVYSLQEQPHDITGLVEQNIANQRKLTNRSEQIDYNVSASNNGYAFSEDNFNEETAKQAATARAKGHPILVPSGGDIAKAIMPLPAQELPSAIFNEIEVVKNDIRGSWGVQGLSAQPPDEDQTARGMILNQAHDSSRIGGIGDAIEQVADATFNWLVQLYYVFYDEEHFASIMGNAKAVEYVTLSAQSLNRQLIVSVSPDSLKPKDEITEINLAQSLFDKGAIGPKTLLKILDFPDPDESAADGLLYKTDPQAYMQLNFPDIMQKMQQAQQQQMIMQQGGIPAQGATQSGPAPEALTEPQSPQGMAEEPASAALSNVKLPPVQAGTA